MTATEIANEVQTQLFSAIQTVQESVVSTLLWVTEQAETIIPDAAFRLADRLPEATGYLDRGFDTAEQWLRSQRDFASKIVDAVKPSASSPASPAA